MDLLTYLRLYEPENLVKVYGNVYCTRQHDSLKISNGKWMWWSRGFADSSTSFSKFSFVIFIISILTSFLLEYYSPFSL